MPETISSGYTAPQPAYVPVTKTWIKDPFEPANNVQLPLETKWMNRTKKNRKSLFLPIGRDKPIILSDKGRYLEFELSFITTTQLMFHKVSRITELNRMLLVQTPKGFWYCEVYGEPTIEENQFNLEESTHRRVTIPFVEVQDYFRV